MLKVKLSQPYYSNRKYVVYLNSDIKASFSNKRSALDFIHLVEHELDQSLVFINDEYSTLTSIYRCYFLADRDFRFKYEVENSFSLIDNRLTFISIHTDSVNFNALIVQAINVCFDELLKACGLILKKSITRYDMLTRNRLQVRIRVIDNYVKSNKEFFERSVTATYFKVKTA